MTKKFVKSAKNVAAAAPSKSSGEPAAARYHYHQNRAASTFVVHKSIEVGGKSVEMKLEKDEFKTREEMSKAVRAWLDSSSHSYDKLAASKHCN